MTNVLFGQFVLVLCFCVYVALAHEDVIDASQLLEGFPSPLTGGGTLSSETGTKAPELKHTVRDSASSSYGLDHSFPIHHVIEDRDSHHHKRYVEQFLGACHRKHDPSTCDLSELYRKYRNLHVPELKVNYTDTGYLKLKAPAAVSDAVMDLFEANKHKAVREQWTEGKTHTNHWDSPPSLLSWERGDVAYGGDEFRDVLEEEIEPLMTKFVNSGAGGTGKALGAGEDAPASEYDGGEEGEGEGEGEAKGVRPLYRKAMISPSGIYGIRIFKTGAIVAPHLDHLPLTLTALICVSQELSEAWPIEVYSHRTHEAVNITLNPGEMLLYEGHSVIHGNPFPLVGKYVAYMYLHFTRKDYNLLNTVEEPDLMRVFEHLQPGQRGRGRHGSDDFATDDMSPDVDESEPVGTGAAALKDSRRHIPTRRELNSHVRFIYNYEPQLLFLGGEEE